MNVTKEHAERHYADLSSKPFFAGEEASAVKKCAAECCSSAGSGLAHHLAVGLVAVYMATERDSSTESEVRRQLSCRNSVCGLILCPTLASSQA